MSRKIFVANMPRSVTLKEFTAEFSKCGEIIKANLVYDPDTKVSKGYGFVVYHTEAEAGVAVQALNGYSFNGRVITVALATNRTQ